MSSQFPIEGSLNPLYPCLNPQASEVLSPIDGSLSPLYPDLNQKSSENDESSAQSVALRILSPTEERTPLLEERRTPFDSIRFQYIAATVFLGVTIITVATIVLLGSSRAYNLPPIQNQCDVITHLNQEVVNASGAYFQSNTELFLKSRNVTLDILPFAEGLKQRVNESFSAESYYVLPCQDKKAYKNCIEIMWYVQGALITPLPNYLDLLMTTIFTATNKTVSHSEKEKLIQTIFNQTCSVPPQVMKGTGCESFFDLVCYYGGK